jgi:hypothetical protein
VRVRERELGGGREKEEMGKERNGSERVCVSLPVRGRTLDPAF